MGGRGCCWWRVAWSGVGRDNSWERRRGGDCEILRALHQMHLQLVAVVQVLECEMVGSPPPRDQSEGIFFCRTVVMSIILLDSNNEGGLDFSSVVARGPTVGRCSMLRRVGAPCCTYH